jgi:hypothetical protein
VTVAIDVDVAQWDPPREQRAVAAAVIQVAATAVSRGAKICDNLAMSRDHAARAAAAATATADATDAAARAAADATEPAVDATFVDALRLVWSPMSLPRLAMTLRSSAALAAGALYWFTFIGAAVAAILTAEGDGVAAPDERIVAFVNHFVLGGFFTACLVYPLAWFASLDADMTSEHHRTRVRFVLLLPGPIILPLLIWGALAIWDVPFAGSRWWIIGFVAAMGWLMQRGWNTTYERAHGDRCVGCGYLLLGLPHPRCPECGRDFYPGQTLK